MSSQSDISTTALGSRANIYDSEGNEWDTTRDPEDPSDQTHDPDSPSVTSVESMLDRDIGHHDYYAGIDRAEYIAGTLLRELGNPTIFCPNCHHELECETELSDPLHHMPLVEVDHEFDPEENDDSREVSKNDHRRHRHCPECNVVTFGGVVAPRDTSEFVEVVGMVLDAVDEIVPETRRTELIADAHARKQRGMSDQANMEHLVMELKTNGSGME
jgi:hypothetical protein